jgi:UDP-N-acetylmuramyl tripeptide synthase
MPWWLIGFLSLRARFTRQASVALAVQKLRFRIILGIDNRVQVLAATLSRLGLSLSPRLMSRLLSHGITARLMPSSLGLAAQGRRVIFVTGTNGKTTTTALLVAALGGMVATNPGNHNFFFGLLDTLLSSNEEIVVLEVDELSLPEAMRWITPELLLVLNLFEDAWHRTPSPNSVIDSWESSLDASRTTVLAWADDPKLVALFQDQPVQWLTQQDMPPVSPQVEVCPQCLGILNRRGRRWICSCSIQHPASLAGAASIWNLSGDGMRLDPPQGSLIPSLTIDPGLMGSVNHRNAAFAAAAAVMVGEEPVLVEQRLRRFDSLSLRDSVYHIAGRDLRLLVAKNPAAWDALLDRFDGHSGVILLQQQVASAVDLSWLYDIPVDFLKRCSVGICGNHALDLAVWLTYSQIDFIASADPCDLVQRMPPGDLLCISDLLGSYLIQSLVDVDE